MLIGMVGLLVVSGTAQPAAAQPAEGSSEGVTVARFDGATAVALDPKGRIYVADARRSAVVMLAPDGTVTQTFGGAGTRPGQFDAPADLDPTNGLTVWIADAGNGRLQHLSQDGQFLEALPVGEAGNGSARRQPVYDASRSADAPMADGEPIAVATTSANEPITIDAKRRGSSAKGVTTSIQIKTRSPPTLGHAPSRSGYRRPTVGNRSAIVRNGLSVGHELPIR